MEAQKKRISPYIYLIIIVLSYLTAGFCQYRLQPILTYMMQGMQIDEGKAGVLVSALSILSIFLAVPFVRERRNTFGKDAAPDRARGAPGTIRATGAARAGIDRSLPAVPVPAAPPDFFVACKCYVIGGQGGVALQIPFHKEFRPLLCGAEFLQCLSAHPLLPQKNRSTDKAG